MRFRFGQALFATKAPLALLLVRNLSEPHDPRLSHDTFPLGPRSALPKGKVLKFVFRFKTRQRQAHA